MATNKKREEFNLNEALSSAESGDAGQLLKSTAAQIEPRAEFVRRLQAQLEDTGHVYAKSYLHDKSIDTRKNQSEPLMGRLLRQFEQTFSGQARVRGRRAASLAFGLVGLVGMVVVLIGMAQMLRMRQEVSRGNGTPTVLAGGVGDIQAFADSFELLHIIKPEPIEGFHGQPLLMKWSPDGQTLATGAGTHVQLWSRETGQPRARLDTPIVRSMEWSVGGGLLAVGTEENKVFLVDAETGDLISTLAGPFLPPEYAPRAWYGEVTGLAWSPDGSMVASLADEAPPTPTPRPRVPSPVEVPNISDRPIQTIRIWDVRTRKQVRAITVPSVFDGSRYAHNLSWSPDGGTLASFTMAGPIRLWDPRTGQQRHQLKVDKDNTIRDVQWSPDGQVLSVVTGRVVQLWDVKSGRVRHTLPQSLPTMPPPPEPVGTIQAPLPVPSVPGSPLPTYPPQPTYVRPTPAPDTYYYVSSVLWSADGKTLSVADFDHIRRWDAVAGRLIETNLTDTYWQVWSSNGRMVASWDGGIKLGDPVTGRLLRTLSPYVTTDIEWSHDGQTLAIGNIDENRETRIKSIEIEVWGSQSPAPPGPEPTPTPDTRTSLPVATMPATETSIATSTASEGTTEVELTPTTVGTPTSTPVLSATVSPDPRRVCSGWSVVDSPNVDTVNELQAVAAVSSDDVWAVGYHSDGRAMYVDGGTPVPGANIEHTLIMHWDGAKWEVVQSPSVAGKHNRLLSVAAISRNDVWAVGYYGDVPDPGSGKVSQTLVMHWDGADWKIVPSPDGGTLNNRLNSVTTVSQNDVWAVGNYDVEFEDNVLNITTISKSLILHWNGTAWKQVESPNPGYYRNTLNGLAATSENDVWAVGEYSSNAPFRGPFGFVTYPLAMHWNGSTWDVTETPNLDDHYGFFKPLSAVTAVSPSEVWAVGSSNSEGSQESVALRWDGKRWVEEKVVVPRPPVESGPPPHDTLLGVVALSKEDIWAVGSFEPYMTGANMGSHVSTLSAHWDGNVWSYVPSPNIQEGLPGIEVNRLNGVAATPAGELWAVGAVVGRGPSSRTLVMRFGASPCTPPVDKATASPSP